MAIWNAPPANGPAVTLPRLLPNAIVDLNRQVAAVVHEAENVVAENGKLDTRRHRAGPEEIPALLRDDVDRVPANEIELARRVDAEAA